MRAFFSLKVVLFIFGQQHSLPCTLFLESSHHFHFIAQKSEGDAKKLKLDCWRVERAKLLKCPVRWCWKIYHCSKNMFVLNFLVPETVIYYLLTSLLCSLILELCLIYVGSSAFHLNELAAYLPR